MNEEQIRKYRSILDFANCLKIPGADLIGNSGYLASVMHFDDSNFSSERYHIKKVQEAIASVLAALDAYEVTIKAEMEIAGG